MNWQAAEYSFELIFVAEKYAAVDLLIYNQ
jgi:hypothetical protein